jgi:hypothetical protein
MKKLLLNKFLLSALLLLGIGNAMADDARLKPFVLASKGAGTIAEKTEQARTALSAAGFSVVGDHQRRTEEKCGQIRTWRIRCDTKSSDH